MLVKEIKKETYRFDVVIVGGGAAGVGICAMLVNLGVQDLVVLERDEVGASFRNWPKEMRLITPSFTTNFYGNIDLNSVISGTSPAFTLGCEHPTGDEYAYYLDGISKHYNLPILENANVTNIEYVDDFFRISLGDNKPIEARFLIWAAGEFQYPDKQLFPGAELCIHNSEVNSWRKLRGREYCIIGYESGIDAAVNLSSLGKSVKVFDSSAPWDDRTTDPSLNLSPYTRQRLYEEILNDRIKLIGDSRVERVTKSGGKYRIKFVDKTEEYISSTKPILATGFKSSLSQVTDFFDWHEEESFALLTEDDESTKTPGLFLVGPQVRHDKIIFCFIYKFRQRFGVVANAIGNRLGLDTSVLESYRSEGLYLDDLSCCGEECEC